MSDRPEESRSDPDVAGGWFVPQQAVTDQQLAGLSAPKAVSVQVPDNTTPQRSGEWYVPPAGVSRAAAMRTADVQQPTAQTPAPSTPAAAAPVAASSPAQPADPAPTAPVSASAAASPVPDGAALSSDIDYSNYVPGRAIAPKAAGDTPAAATGDTSDAPSSADPATTGAAVAAADAGSAQASQVAAGAQLYVPSGQAAAAAPAQSNAQVQFDEFGMPVPPQTPPPADSQAAFKAVEGKDKSAQADQSAAQAGNAAAAAGTPSPAPTGAAPVVADSVSASQPAAPAVNPELAQRYTDVEQSVQVLRRRYTAGTLTRDQLQTELRKLMILDQEGYWWMIGMESDRWYRYNGKDWIPATPAGRTSDADAAAPASGSPAAGASRALPRTANQPAAASPAAAVDFPQNRQQIPVDEYGMPLPQQVPINDLGATMVGKAAPRLDSTIPMDRGGGPGATVAMSPASAGSGAASRGATSATVPAASGGTPRYFARASGVSASSPAFDGGATMPSATIVNAANRAGGTQAATAVAGGAVADLGATGPSIPAPTGKDAPASLQPDYGVQPGGFAATRAQRTGCLIRAAIISVFLALIGSVLLIGGAVAFYFSIINTYTPKIDALSTAVQQAAQSARIMDINGRVLYQINDPNSGARIQVPLDQISPYMIAATIRIEDQRFYTNPGFDPVSIVRAILQNLRAGVGVSGASSITQQLARALVLDPGAAQDRSSARKITEIIVSSEIARRYSKNDILEFYLNTVYYGNLAYGVEAASETYFGINAKDLNLAQAAFLAGLVQAPATYDPINNRDAAMGRFDDVLKLMPDLGCIQMEHAPYDKAPFCIHQADVDQAVVQIAMVKATTFKSPTTSAIYPHFVNYVEQQLEAKFGKDAVYTSGFNVYTTIDPKVQDLADQAVKTQIAALTRLHVTNGAVLSVRPSDGAILAMVGSVDFNNKDFGQFNATLAPRQPGSSIKPFVYLAAMERDANGSYWTPSTIIWDVPSCFGTSPAYCPRNYTGQFLGPVSAREALTNSLNIPAVKTLQYIGIDRFKQMAARVGIEFPLTQPDTAGLSSALGGVEVPLIDMVQGYSVLADGGNKVPFYAITKVTTKSGNTENVVFQQPAPAPQQVADPGMVYLITNMLSDNAARAAEFGNLLNLAGGRLGAVKTGTTNDSKDNWTIGYTPSLVVGVWVGNNDNTAMVGTSGVTGAAPIWKQVMDGVLSGTANQPFTMPGSDQQVQVCRDFGTADFQDCPTHATDVIFSANPLPSPDSVLKTLPVDTFSGLVANQYCPDYVENRVFMVINDPTAISWLNSDPKGQAWAKAHNLTLPVTPPPTTACDPNTLTPKVKIETPPTNSTVMGLLEIRGVVGVPGFNRYQLEVGQGANATQFNIVDGPITAQAPNDNSFLGRWDTTSLPNGVYTLRLIGFDGQGHSAQFAIPLNVNNTQPTAIPGNPTAVPTDANAVQPTASTDQNTQVQNGLITATPIVINSNNSNPGAQATPTMKLMFPPTASQ